MKVAESKFVDDPTFWAIKENAAGHRVVLVSGCFCLFDLNVLYFLQAARKLGEALIAVVTYDNSVMPPIIKARMRRLAALPPVDAVASFNKSNTEQDAPMLLRIEPGIWAVASNYCVHPFDADIARDMNTQLTVLPYFLPCYLARN